MVEAHSGMKIENGELKFSVHPMPATRDAAMQRKKIR
jgi:hypothetical protein